MFVWMCWFGVGNVMPGSWCGDVDVVVMLLSVLVVVLMTMNACLRIDIGKRIGAIVVDMHV